MKIISKIKNIIEYAVVTIASSDRGDNQVVQFDATGKSMDCNVVNPYGLSSNAPSGSSILKFLINGSSQDVCGIPFNSANRFQNLKQWEVAVGNFLKKNRIFFDENGGIIIEVVEDGQNLTLQTSTGNIKILETGTVSINDGNLEILP